MNKQPAAISIPQHKYESCAPSETLDDTVLRNPETRKKLGSRLKVLIIKREHNQPLPFGKVYVNDIIRCIVKIRRQLQ